jgi:PAS domain S-box-containing protein
MSSASASELIQASLIGEAVDGGPALVFVADEYMRYLAVNRYACELLGYSREELLELRVSDVAVAADIEEVYAHMLKSAQASGRTPLRCKDGTLLPFSFRAKETTAATMTFWVTVGFVDEPEA